MHGRGRCQRRLTAARVRAAHRWFGLLAERGPVAIYERLDHAA
jgi:hypothetical protein